MAHGLNIPAMYWTMPYQDVERAARDGRMTGAQWEGYRAVWLYSATRFSDFAYAIGPRVRDIHAELDRLEA